MAKVLIIDDDEEVREALVSFLLSTDHQPEGVEDGMQALQTMVKGDHGLIVLDVSSPGVGGIELVKELHRQGSCLPIVAMTGAGGVIPPLWSQKGVEAFGVSSFLIKPFDMQTFREVVLATCPNHCDR